MSTIVSFLALAIGLLGLSFSILSLVFLWSRKDEHPDVSKLRGDIIDIYDKVDHWMKRDAVRRARAKREGEDELPLEAPPVNHLAMTTAEWKAQQRAKLLGRS